MLKKIALVFTLINIMNLGFLRSQEVSKTSYSIMLAGLLSSKVPATDVKAVSQKPEKYVFLDAREKSEFKVSHIENSIWVGYDDFDTNRVSGIDKSLPIVVYCSVGYRSEKVTQKLREAGFSNVQNLYGGIFEWVNQNQPVVDSNGNETNKVHAFDKVWGIWLNKGEKVYD